MYHRFGKAFYYFSIFIFLFLLLYFYSAMSEQVIYNLGESESGGGRIGKDSLFYGLIGAFILFNVIAIFPAKMLETKTHQKMHRIFPLGDPYRDYMLTWFYSFGGVLNVSLGIMTFYFHAINNQEGISSDYFNVFFYLIPVLLVVWIIGLVALFVGKAKQLKA
ncbi:DNA topoisomerase IV [Algoriphagus sp.]|uniref:DNA topoisomerase IV n=1 Tax=Algoriphagus sp. TaxID=1872435 RepID=UPI002618F5C1|nr:DNA topoisomerase IV [Algoriphagus sp.]